MPALLFLFLLNDPCLFKCLESAVLLDVAHALGRDNDLHGFAGLRNEDILLVKVRLAAHLTDWVELGSARLVRVASAYLC